MQLDLNVAKKQFHYMIGVVSCRSLHAGLLKISALAIHNTHHEVWTNFGFGDLLGGYCFVTYIFRKLSSS